MKHVERSTERYRLSGITHDEVDEEPQNEGCKEPTPYCSHAWKSWRQSKLKDPCNCNSRIDEIIFSCRSITNLLPPAEKTILLCMRLCSAAHRLYQHENMHVMSFGWFDRSGGGHGSPTFESLPGVDDAVAVAVEEGHVLLKHAHAAGVAPLGPLRVARVHRLESSREICEPGERDEKKTKSMHYIWITALLIRKQVALSFFERKKQLVLSDCLHAYFAV